MFNILLVDDEPLIRRGLRTIINRNFSNFAIVGEASNGLEALQLLQQNNVDVVISDIRMPFKDGIELVKDIHENYPYIFTIIISGYNDFEYAKQAIKYKVYEYLLKPIDTKEFIDLMKKLELELQNQITHENNKNYLNLHITGNISSLFIIVHEKDLLLNIKLMNKQKVSNIIDSIFTHVKDNNMSLFSVQQFTLELMSMICNELSSLFGNGDITSYIVGSYAKSLQIQNSFESILSWFVHNILLIIDNMKNQKDCITEDETISKIKKYIKDNYYENITLNTLSEKFFLNPSYLSDLFKSETGENFLDFLTKIRIEKSLELMKDRELKIYEIAQMVGYNSEKHFHRTFKKITNLTPGDYRRSM